MDVLLNKLPDKEVIFIRENMRRSEYFLDLMIDISGEKIIYAEAVLNEELFICWHMV